MEQKKILISKLEKVLINLFTPIVFASRLSTSSFEEIVERNERNYVRLLYFMTDHNTIDPRVKVYYYTAPCGCLMVVAACLRKYKMF